MVYNFRRILEMAQHLIPLTRVNVSKMVDLIPLARARVVLVQGSKTTLNPCFCSHGCLQLLYKSDPPGGLLQPPWQFIVSIIRGYYPPHYPAIDHETLN